MPDWTDTLNARQNGSVAGYVGKNTPLGPDYSTIPAGAAASDLALPFFTEVLTRPTTPQVVGTLLDPTFNLAADPGLEVIAGLLCLVWEVGDSDPIGNVHHGRIYLSTTTRPDRLEAHYKISHDDTHNFNAPQLIVHNDLVHCFYTEGAVSPPGALTQGIMWERHIPLAQFPSGTWSTAAVAFDPTLVPSWNGIATKRCLDNQAVIQWEGRWFLLCGDGNDAKIYGRWAGHFTRDWVADGQDIAGGGPVLDVAASSWLKTMTEMRARWIGGNLYLIFGGKRRSDNKRGLVVYAVDQLAVDGPAPLDGSWLRKDHAFTISTNGSAWDGQDIHCGDVVAYKGQWVVAYDARPTSPGSAVDNWKVGLATAPIAGNDIAVTGPGERMASPGAGDFMPLSAPNWRLGNAVYHRRLAGQLLDWLNAFQSLQTDTTATFGALAGSLKWYGGALGPDGATIYGAPLNATTVLKVVTGTDTASTIDISGLAGAASTNKWVGAVLAPNGIIYCIPFSATAILRIDPATDTCTLIDISGLTGGSGTFKWFGGVLGPNGKIYCVPQDAQGILKIDPATDTASIIDISALAGASATGKWNGGVLAANGAIYCAPMGANSILRIDTASDVATVFGTPGAAVDKCMGGALAANGKIYFAPYSGNNVIKVDPATDTLTSIAFGSGVTQYMGLVAAPNGKVYGIPRDATVVLKIDPATDAVTSFGSLAGTGKWMGGLLASNGFIYGIPRNSTTVLKILSALTLPSDVVLSRILNRAP